MTGPLPTFRLEVTDLASCPGDWRRVLPDGDAAAQAQGGLLAHRVFAGPQAAALAAARAALAAAAAPGPVTVLAPLPDGASLASLGRAGLSGWWPLDSSAAPALLRSCLHQDQVRWHLAQARRDALLNARAQLDEQRWVDRAKGVLMQARQLADDDAMRLLQGAATGAGMPLGVVARAVTEAAQWAEAVNRSGRLRMLSQRLIKLAAQVLAGVDTRRARQAQGVALRQVEASLALLDELPVMRGAHPSARQALEAVHRSWQALRTLLLARLSLPLLQQADSAADALLAHAEALTDALESGGARRALHLVNLCGRQRMQVQRLAKEALLASLLGQPERMAQLPALMEVFETALRELEHAPLGSPAARATLDAARVQWLHLLRGLRLADGPEGRHGLAVASDALLVLFDQLTDDYEHSLQLILA
jgi:hypothetical protein